MVESASYFPRVVTHRRNRWAPLRVFFRWKISDPDDNGSGISPHSVCFHFLGLALALSTRDHLHYTGSMEW